MRNAASLLMVTLLVSTILFARDKAVTVDLKNAQGGDVGTAKVTGKSRGTQIHLNVKNLPPGTHAIHIHESPKCEAPGFQSAGAHLNRDQKQHGMQNPNGHHTGDLPNFEVKQDGTAKTKIIAKNVGADTLRGVSLVIHEKADDNKTDPSGNSGARIACGVIPN